MATYNAYYGRTGTMVDRCMVLSNDTEGHNTPAATWLILLNEARSEVAQHGLWMKTAVVNIAANTAEVVLTAVTDLVELLSVHWTATHSALIRLGTLDEYQRAQEVRNIYVDPTTETGRPHLYLFASGHLFLFPVYASAVTGGLTLTYRYLPAAMNGATGQGAVTSVEGVPEAFDDMFVYYALKQHAMRDKNARNMATMIQFYDKEYLRHLGRFKSSGESTQLRPYR